MPTIAIESSPLVPGIAPVEIYYREFGYGIPLIFLHGGWGYEVYPFDRQMDQLFGQYRVIIPDRSGYGRSTRLEEVPTDFHRRAAVETMRLLDALSIERPVLWGHSDGAVIAAMVGLSEPDRIAGLILEAFHFLRSKPASRAFFETMAVDPALLGERVTAILAREHGSDYWHRLIVNNGRAWLRIADESRRPDQDLYEGKLHELSVPTVFIHGGRDPRTEPGELDAVARAIGADKVKVIEGGAHSPHSESPSFQECSRLALEFLRGL